MHLSVVSTDENDGTVVEIIKNNNDDNVDVTTYDDFLADHHPILKDLLGRHLLSGKRSPKDDCFVWDKVHYICFCLLYTSPSPRDATLSRMPSSA